jgi:trehalose 6-phosphate synthase/phosphatase
MRKVINVALRLPWAVTHRDGKLIVARSPGGVASGLQTALSGRLARWVGWPGDVSTLTAAESRRLRAMLARKRLTPVRLPATTFAKFYEGYANAVLWPLFHSLPSPLPLSIESWDAYEDANQAFARAARNGHSADELYWVHDYQLFLVPELLRAARRRAKIGFFLHIPFPNPDLFQILPQGEQILRGILGADVVGFHTDDYLRNFAACLESLPGVKRLDDSRVHFDGRTIQLGVHPMGVDFRRLERYGRATRSTGAVDALRRRHGMHLILGIDRLDYTKGIPHRMLAFNSLLKRYPEWHGHVLFLQVAVPSRTGVPAYGVSEGETEQLIGRIHGAFATPHWVPIHYLHTSLGLEEVVALYGAADVMVVTPLRDGMNLVAKEFVASRVDEDGVLILSRFAGAARELPEAMLVNPYDVHATADALHQALRMSPQERLARMRALRRRVQASDVREWARNFLRALSQPESDRATLQPARRPKRKRSPRQIEAKHARPVAPDALLIATPFLSAPGATRAPLHPEPADTH